MAKPEDKLPAKPGEIREARLGRALRDNLRRRKATPASDPAADGPERPS